MPFDPVQVYGALPDYDRLEFRETGLLTETVKFTPEQEIKQKKGHEPGALGQVKQVQVWRGTLAIELKGGVIPNAQGKCHGLAAVYPGQAVTCAHFAAAVEGDAPVPAIERFGYTRDPDKLLMVEGPSLDLGEEAPNVTVPMRYFPAVSKNPIAIAV